MVRTFAVLAARSASMPPAKPVAANFGQSSARVRCKRTSAGLGHAWWPARIPLPLPSLCIPVSARTISAQATTPFVFTKRTSTTAPSPAAKRRAVVLRRPAFPREVGWSRAYPLLQPFPFFRVHSANPAPSVATSFCKPASEIDSKYKKARYLFEVPGPFGVKLGNRLAGNLRPVHANTLDARVHRPRAGVLQSGIK